MSPTSAPCGQGDVRDHLRGSGARDERQRGAVRPPPGARGARSVSREGGGPYSHSMVPGGLLVTSSTTRLTSATSLVIRVEILASTSYGNRVQSAVIASSLDTGRSTIGWP